MQRWVLTEGLRFIAGMLALIASCQPFQGTCVLGQQRSFGPVSTLGPVIEPQDLEFESTFSNLLGGNPLRSPARVVKQDHPKTPIWVAPKDRAPKDYSKREIAGPNLQGPRLKSPQQAVQSPQQEVASQQKKPISSVDSLQARLEAKVKPIPHLAARMPLRPQVPAAGPVFGKAESPSDSGTAGSKVPKAETPKSKSQKSNSTGSRIQAKPEPKTQPKTKPRVEKKLPPLSKQQQQLRAKVRRVLTHYYGRPMNTRDRSPWELMHAMLAFEVHSQVLQGGPQGKPITAVGWMCFNLPCKQRNLMYVNDAGQMRVKVGPALQGHHGQLLAMLAQSSVKKDYPMRIGEEQFQVADLIEMEKQTCYPRTELTFKLISLMHYLDSDAHWLNDQGLEWDIPRLIREELRQPVRGAACGGTHRLAGLTLAYKTRIKRKEPVDGDYLRAKKFVQNYQRYAYRLQNSDGSFSTEWFRGRGDQDDVDRRLKTTGHILEWLLYTATEKELHSWKTTRAANYLANIMYNNRYRDWEAGPLGHAVHALLLYDRKVFGKYDRWNSDLVAHKPSK
ncbi:MAG: hypothetical protein ABGX16_23180 [Pirellulales bacterium]